MEPGLTGEKTIYRITFVLLFCIAAAIIVAVIWASDKGFELSDESYYAVAAQYPQKNELLNSYFGIITNKLYPVDHQVRDLRLWRLVVQGAALIIFVWTWVRFFRQRYRPGRALTACIALIIFIAGFLNYDYLPMAISYNTWSFVFALIFMACMIGSADARPPARFLLYTLQGFVCCLLFFNKLPNGVVLIGTGLLHMSIYRRSDLARCFAGVLPGIALGCLFLFGDLSSTVLKTDSMLDNLRVVSGTPVSRYLKDVYDFVFARPGYGIVLIEVLFVVLMWLVSARRLPAAVAWTAALLNLLAGFRFMSGNGEYITNDITIIFIFCCTLAGIAVHARHRLSDAGSETLFFVVILFLLPFLLAAGTSNVIFYTASQAGTFIIAGALGVLLALSQGRPGVIICLAGVLLSLQVAAVVWHGMVVSPYRQSDLRLKRLPLTFSSRYKSQLEDPGQFVALAALHSRTGKWNKGRRPMLVSPPVMGVLLLTGAVPETVCWLADPPEMAEQNRFLLRKMSPGALPFMILSEEIVRSSVQRKVFEESGFSIKNDYVLCDSVFLNANSKYFYFCKPLR